MDSRTTLVHGSNVHYLFGGTYGKPTIVIIHAWSLDSSVHRKLGELLEKDFYVLIPDLPGHGRTEIRGKPSLSSLAAFIGEFMTTMDIESAALVGHSLGGGVAIQFADTYPERVNHLVLFDSTGQRVTHPFIGWVWVAVSSALLALPYNLTAEARVIWSATSNCLQHPKWLWEMLRLPTTADLTHQLKRSRGKTTIVWAEHDRYYPDCGDLCQSADVDPIIIRGIGHEWSILRPKQASGYIRRAVRSLE